MVIPLMLVEVASGLALLFTPAAPPAPVQGWQVVCLAIIWISTFAIQVPLHRRLERGHDAQSVERLIRTNWIRTITWTAKAALLFPSLA